MFRHVVMFRWREDATSEQRRAVSDSLAALPGSIPELRAYRFGSDAGLKPDNYHFVVVADFDDQAGYETYRDHPAHRAIVDTHVDPITATRAAVQFTY